MPLKPRTGVLGNFQPSLRGRRWFPCLTQHSPGFPVRCSGHVCVCGFLYGKPHQLSDSNKLHRKSGSVLGYSQPELTKLGDEQAAGWSNLLNALKRTRANKIGLVAFCCLCPSTSPGREPCIPLKP